MVYQAARNYRKHTLLFPQPTRYVQQFIQTTAQQKSRCMQMTWFW